MSTNPYAASVSQSRAIRHCRIYKNDGDRPLIALLGRDTHQVLDVGRGAGDKAELIQSLQSEGVLDETHLRFFSYLTVDRYLLKKSPELELVLKDVTGSVPQWWLRQYFLPKKVCEFIDELGCRLWPNLFGSQILLKAFRGHSAGYK
jgi:hypothetical protein